MEFKFKGLGFRWMQGIRVMPSRSRARLDPDAKNFSPSSCALDAIAPSYTPPKPQPETNQTPAKGQGTVDRRRDRTESPSS